MMAIGDNWNDLSMLDVAGVAVLMENAPEDLKRLAAGRGWTMAGHHARDGVAEAIEHHFPGTREQILLTPDGDAASHRLW